MKNTSLAIRLLVIFIEVINGEISIICHYLSNHPSCILPIQVASRNPGCDIMVFQDVTYYQFSYVAISI